MKTQVVTISDEGVSVATEEEFQEPFGSSVVGEDYQKGSPLADAIFANRKSRFRLEATDEPKALSAEDHRKLVAKAPFCTPEYRNHVIALARAAKETSDFIKIGELLAYDGNADFYRQVIDALEQTGKRSFATLAALLEGNDNRSNYNGAQYVRGQLIEDWGDLIETTEQLDQLDKFHIKATVKSTIVKGSLYVDRGRSKGGLVKHWPKG